MTERQIFPATEPASQMVALVPCCTCTARQSAVSPAITSFAHEFPLLVERHKPSFQRFTIIVLPSVVMPRTSLLSAVRSMLTSDHDRPSFVERNTPRSVAANQMPLAPLPFPLPGCTISISNTFLSDRILDVETVVPVVTSGLDHELPPSVERKTPLFVPMSSVVAFPTRRDLTAYTLWFASAVSVHAPPLERYKPLSVAAKVVMFVPVPVVANAQTVRPGRSLRTGETIRSGEVAVWANIGTTAVLTSISRNSTINVRR